MTELERMMSERSGELIRALNTEVGLSRSQAARFLTEARPALQDSWQWHEDAPSADADGPLTVRELLGGVNGRELAERAGLSVESTWAALRMLGGTMVRDGVVEAAHGIERSSLDDLAALRVGFGHAGPRPADHARPPSNRTNRSRFDFPTETFGLRPTM